MKITGLCKYFKVESIYCHKTPGYGGNLVVTIYLAGVNVQFGITCVLHPDDLSFKLPAPVRANFKRSRLRYFKKVKDGSTSQS